MSTLIFCTIPGPAEGWEERHLAVCEQTGEPRFEEEALPGRRIRLTWETTTGRKEELVAPAQGLVYKLQR